MGPARHYEKLRARSRTVQTSTSTTWRPAWSTDHAFATRSAPTWRKKLNITPEEAAQRHANDYALKRRHHRQRRRQYVLVLREATYRGQITGADIPVDGGWAALVTGGPHPQGAARVRLAGHRDRCGGSRSRMERFSRSVRPDAMPAAKETVDRRGACTCCRGAIDVHVHFPRSRLSATRRTSRAARAPAGVRRCHHHIRHAEHDPDGIYARKSSPPS